MNPAIEIVKKSCILTPNNLDGLCNLEEELWDNFLHTQIFRTRTEMEMSVLQDMKHPTPDAKYWQAQREQKAMFHELVMLSYEYRKGLVEIKKLQRKLEAEQDDLERELLEIEIEKQVFIAKNQERVAKDRIREIQEWHEIKEDLKPRLKHGTEDVNRHQRESYIPRLENQARAALCSGGSAEKVNALGQLTTLHRLNGTEMKLLVEKG